MAVRALLAFCSVLAGCRGAGDSWVVRPDSFGSLPLPATLAQASAVLGEPLAIPADTMNGGCGYVNSRSTPPGTALMISFDTIVRVDVDTAGILTAESIGVGDSEARALQVYAGRARVEPHPYDGPEGHYLVVPSTDDTLHLLIFETDGKKIVRFRAGRRPQVELIEGCS